MATANKAASDEIDAAPTKAFFVEMLIRDIALEQAVLDLIDNSVDGAKRFSEDSLADYEVNLTIDSKKFRIQDNCGGFDKKSAREYAFRFGRPTAMPQTPYSIGQFGVGMKRALFKFGRHFTVRSATEHDRWAVDVDVAKWEADADDWHFHWAEFGDETEISRKNPGTDILVKKLRTEVALRFGTEQFENAIIGLVKSKHRQFIARGMTIRVNEKHLDATDLKFSSSTKLQPGVSSFTFGAGQDAVKVRIVVGVSQSSPREAGWFVVCNGRVILEADRRKETGWGLVEENGLKIPSYHNQFARFRGVIYFDAKDASKLPWNTTKTDIDPDRPIWQKSFERMTEMMRPVIDFLNQLDADVTELGNASPLQQQVTRAAPIAADRLTKKSEFKYPKRGTLKSKKVPDLVKISYSRPARDTSILQDALDVNSPREVGEKCFDILLARHKK